MNTDDSGTGQQGYGSDQETGQQQGQAPEGQQNQPFGQQSQQQPQSQNAQPLGGNDSNTGSGTTMSAGSSTGEFETGQASYGNSGQADAMTQTQSQNRPDQGQEADLGQGAQGGEGGGGFVGSSADNSSEYLQSGSDNQDFAEQGQGALDEDDDDDIGTTDIETERSEGRESDIEGSSL